MEAPSEPRATEGQPTAPLRVRLIRAATGSFGLNAVSSAVVFLTTVVLARLLGAAGYGVYSYALSWIGLLALPVVMGFDRLLVRETARYHATSSWGALRGLLQASDRSVLVTSALAALALVCVTWLVSPTQDPRLSGVLYCASLLLPLQAVVRLRQSTLAGLEKVVLGQVPEMVVRPVLLLGCVLLASLALGESLDAQIVMALNVATMFVAMVWGMAQQRRELPGAARLARPEFHLRAWAAAAFPMFLIGGMQMLNSQTDVIMLGLLTSSEEVGIYSVAVRGTRLILMVMIAVNVAIGPVVAKMVARRELVRLQQLATRSARGMFAASLPVGLGLIAFGHWFLLIFGEPFLAGRDALTILSVGKLINVFAGSGGIILVMAGHEKAVAVRVGLAAMLNVVLNAVLIPPYGIEGAAFATASCEIFMSLSIAWALFRRIGIHSTALGPLPRGGGHPGGA